jgi:hypothetical protein
MPPTKETGVPDIVTLQAINDDGTASVRLWFVADGQRSADVARLLGEPSASQIYTAEQMEQAHASVGPVPTVFRD